MRQEKPEGWYSKKSFAHFDVPLKFDQAKSLIEGFRESPSHSFLPFIGFSDVKRRFKPKSKKPGKNVFESKSRDLRYCAHRDGYIHAYYAKQLNVAYEKFLSGVTWGNSVIGYRARRGTNIHMAKNAFE
jgi:RNA-directed DNA polymerase